MNIESVTPSVVHGNGHAVIAEAYRRKRAKAQLYRARAKFRRELDHPGVTYRRDVQVYILDRFESWTNRYGRPVTLAVWRARCIECGAWFETALRWGDPPATRRCIEHRKSTRAIARSGPTVEPTPAVPAPETPPAVIVTDTSATLVERLELLTGIMLDLGTAIERMTSEASASRHENRQVNEKLDRLLRVQTETRRALGQTALHIPPHSTRRRPLA